MICNGVRSSWAMSIPLRPPRTKNQDGQNNGVRVLFLMKKYADSIGDTKTPLPGALLVFGGQGRNRTADTRIFRACKYLILRIISTSYRGVRCAICSTMQDYSGPNHAKFTQEKLSDSHHKIRSKIRLTGLPRVAARIADYSGFE